LEEGAVVFSGRWAKTGKRYRVAMQPNRAGGGGLSVRPVPTQDVQPVPNTGSGGSGVVSETPVRDINGNAAVGRMNSGGTGTDDDVDRRVGGEEELAAAMALFFGALMIDLKGTQLKYRDMAGRVIQNKHSTDIESPTFSSSSARMYEHSHSR
jgi:hypothetical protein